VSEPAESFDANYIPEPNSGCWLWLGSAYPDHPGKPLRPKMFFGDRRVYAHRFSYERFKGPIPAGLQVCHRCNTPMCVNPEHLYAGTAKENIGDAIRAGTHFSLHAAKFARRGSDSPDGIAVKGVFPDGRVLLFGSQKEAGRHGYSSTAINHCLRGRMKTYLGAIWTRLESGQSLALAEGGEG
jgi:hypothetical protein